MSLYYSSDPYDDWPEPPGPTLEDECAMSGHPLGEVNPETLEGYCHCDSIYYPPQGEPHDEYSGQCANLIDEYVALLVSCWSRREHHGASESLRTDLGRELRHKTPAYLQSLISSLSASKCQMTGDCPRLIETHFDFFERIGVHLNLDGELAFQTFVARLGGDADYIATEFDVRNKPYDTGVLDEGDNLQVTRHAARFYSLLQQGMSGWEWRRNVTSLLLDLIPMFRTRPELIEAAAVVVNQSGDIENASSRALALMESEPLPVSIVDGFL